MQERLLLICENIPKGAKVLDVGCIGDPAHHFKDRERWLFHRLGNITDKLKGIDINEEWVTEANRLGYHNIVFGNIENYKFDCKFDVVTAGELIEHVSNPGQFIVNMGEHLEIGGTLIISTPNVFSLNNLSRAVLGRKTRMHPEHVVGFDENLLIQLLVGNGFIVEKIYFAVERAPGIKNSILRFASRMVPRYGANIVVVARKA